MTPAPATLPRSPLHAPYCADRASFVRVEIAEQEQLARDTWRLRFIAPEIARQIVPGQFVMIRLAGGDDPLLGRPLALYDTVLDASGAPIGIDVVYLVVGKVTSRLARLRPGAMLEVWGPLGNGFSPQECRRLVMTAGGIGQTPFLALAREALGLRRFGNPDRRAPRVDEVVLCYGARTAALLAGVADFQSLGVDVRIATDDGSAGHHGLVTHLLAEALADPPAATRVVCCGPEKMMHAASELVLARGVPCEVSLETPMACGIGICFSCVAQVRQPDGSWDYKRTCVEGPIFPAEKIVW